MPDEKDREKEMEVLSRAIVEAIMKSRNVRQAIEKLSQKEDVASSSLMVLMLKLQNLAESINVDQPDKDSFSDEEDGSVDEHGSKDNIDNTLNNSESCEEGKKLSPNEIAFRDFLAGRFDQDKWLKKHGLII